MKKLFTLLISISILTYGNSQSNQDQLSVFSEKIQVIEEEFLKREQALIDDVEILNEQISKLKEEELFSLDNLVNRVEAIESKQQKLDEISIQEKNKEIELVKVRYEAGKLVIKDMIEFLNTIKTQFSTMAFQQSYSSLTNPNTYKDYESNVIYLKKKISKIWTYSS